MCVQQFLRTAAAAGMFCGALALGVAVAAADATESSAGEREAQKIEMFSAIESGDIEVSLIAKDSTTANVIITNKSKKPLSIELPAAFAGVPVLAQFDDAGGGFGGGGNNGGGFGGGNQGLGGGFGGGGFGGGGGGFGGGGFGGGGFFNVAPEKTRKIKVATVCLEHGKDDPNPRIQYQIKPIETLTDKPEVIELCKMLGSGKLPQNIAQAAAWHLANGLSWQELATKEKVRHLNGSVEMYFNPQELRLAVLTASEAQRRAEQYESKSAGKENSLSRQ